MKKILITGGSGFIGLHLREECEKEGIEYLSLSNTEHRNLSHERCVDLLDYDGLKGVIADFRPDAIVHLAAIASPVHSDIAEIYRINVCGTENLLNAAAETVPGSKLVLTSTAGVYGNQNVQLLNEGLPFNPVNHYSCSKMVTEVLSRQYTDRLNISIVRPFNIIGPGQNENFFVPKLVRHFVQRVPEIELGNMEAIRDYVSVDYCAQVMLKLTSKKDEELSIVNICTGVGHSCADVLSVLEKITDYHPQIRTTEKLKRNNEIWSLVGDPNKLKQLMGAEQQSKKIEDILTEMLDKAQHEVNI